jgi:hypothetical protein
MSQSHRALLISVLISGLAESAAGQVSGTLDLGAGTYRPERAIPGGVASIAPSLRYDAGLFRLGATGVYSDAPAGRWNFQATGTAAARSPRLAMFDLEALGEIDWTRHYQVEGTNTITGELRAYAHPAKDVSVWFGRAFGSASSLGRRRPVRRTHIGTTARVGSVQVGVSLASTSFDLMPGLFTGTDGTGHQAADPLEDTTTTVTPNSSGQVGPRASLTDAVLSGRWRFADFDLDVALGRRFSKTKPELTIWGFTATRSLTSDVALVAGAGRAGSDPVTSVPGARYLVLGLRLKLNPLGTPSITVPAPAPDHTPFRVGPALPAGREISLRAPTARVVELAGDFTDWNPILLRYSGAGVWRTILPIAPGLHRLAVRIDGGQWQAPPGSRPITSEFGSEVAEIVVE